MNKATMNSETDLDVAHGTMTAAPDDGTQRLGFYARLIETELFLLLEQEPKADIMNPKVISIEGADYVMVFDRADRLAEFSGDVAAYASLAGRDIALMLKDQKLGLAVNAGVAPSSILIPVDGVNWLCTMLENQGETRSEKTVTAAKPMGIDQRFLQALREKLTQAAGLAFAAYLIDAKYETGERGTTLAFIDAVEQAKPSLANLVSETVRFHPKTGRLDVGFFAANDAIAADIIAVGEKIEMTVKISKKLVLPLGPGLDPDKPPNLR